MEKKRKISWIPQTKQIIMMNRGEDEGLYGGAAGGGKSDFLLVEALRQIQIPHYRGIIFRKTFPQLTELIDRSHELYKNCPGARYNGTMHCWSFKSGAKIYFGNMQHVSDRTNYQGKHYDFIGFDELTHFTWDEYSYMLSRNRPSGPGTRIYMRATANPGGIGHGWVKDYFVTAGKPYETVVFKQKVRFPDGKQKIFYRTKVFVPSTVFDNKILLENDPGYLARLATLPEQERKALLYGDWNVFAGQVFREFRDNPDGYKSQIMTHVIEPCYIPHDWLIYRGFDFGYAKPFSVGWHAVDHDGCIYRIREFYGCTGTPNEGVKMEPTEIARRIKEIENTDPLLKRKKIIGIADPAIYDESRGESVAAMMERQGVYFSPADHTRLAGKMQFHYRLAFGENGRPMLYVFNTCKDFIRTIPALVYDEKKVEDIDTDCEDHIYDECRYVLMEHPISPRKNEEWVVPEEDPLDLYKDRRNTRFYRI